jgi:hypothetical protein
VCLCTWPTHITWLHSLHNVVKHNKWLKQWLATNCCQLLLKRDFETKERGPTTLDITRTLHMCVFMQWMIARSTVYVCAARSLVNSARQDTKLTWRLQCSRELLSGIELYFGLEGWLGRIVLISTRLCSYTRICCSIKTRAIQQNPSGPRVKSEWYL